MVSLDILHDDPTTVKFLKKLCHLIEKEVKDNDYDAILDFGFKESENGWTAHVDSAHTHVSIVPGTGDSEGLLEVSYNYEDTTAGDVLSMTIRCYSGVSGLNLFDLNNTAETIADHIA